MYIRVKHVRVRFVFRVIESSETTVRLKNNLTFTGDLFLGSLQVTTLFTKFDETSLEPRVKRSEMIL